MDMDLKPIIKPTPVGNKRHYVYTLAFPQGLLAPDGEGLSDLVFYVGRGTWCKPPMVQRIDSHEHEAKNNGACSLSFDPRPLVNGRYAINWHKIDAIRHIWMAGESVVKNVVFETSVEREAEQVEKVVIKQYIAPYLTNHENYVQRKKGDWFTPAFRSLPSQRDF